MGRSLIKLPVPVIRNAQGKRVRLTNEEAGMAKFWEREIHTRFKNALGYEISITTLTSIVKDISEQKFFEIPPAEYLPVVVGQGAWGTVLTTWRSFELSDDFETGIVNTGAQSARQASVDAGVDSVNVKIYNWDKAIGYSIFDLQQAARASNWDLVSGKEKARKKNWDLGIQRIAFLGARGLNGAGGSCLGLLNQPSVTVNTTVITKPIHSMSTAELQTFCGTVVEAYRSNCARTTWPTHFIIPESDYNGLAQQASPDFPIKSTLAVLEEMFQTIVRNKSFKILPLAYGDVAYSGYSQQVYVLLNYDKESIRMDIPVDYTNTVINSLDNFNFQNVGYGQFTGVQTYRPLEMLYFKFTPS